MLYNEEDFLSISGIQHFVFCRRQWALIHIEQQWDENIYTVDGKIFHNNAHNGMQKEVRGNIIITRGLPVFSRKLGINGICDVVEFKRDPDGINLFETDGKWQPVPIEYKVGKPKEDDCDALQLLAQAVCLEEMLSCDIKKGYLFYGNTRHRTEIVFSDELRKRLSDITNEMHEYYKRSRTPNVKKTKRCKNCSIRDLCLPDMMKYSSAKKYMQNRIMEMENESD